MPPSSRPPKRPYPGSSPPPLPSSRRPTSSSVPLARVISRVTTPARTRTGTHTATRGNTGRQEDAFVIAVIENSIKEIGFCAYNLRGFDIELRQFTDSSTYSRIVTALVVFAPVEMLLCVSSAGGPLDQAIQASSHLASVKRTFIGRPYFNETYGALMAEKLSNVKCPNLHNLGESSCYLALACCGALIRYVEHTDEVSFAPSSLRIRYRPNDNVVILDMSALEGLEIVSNARQRVGVGGKGASDCLLRVMDKTKTRAGKRFLRRSLLEPNADMVDINMRQDAVGELTNSEEMYFALIAILARFPDLESATAALMARENARLRSIGYVGDARQTDSTSGEESNDSTDEGIVTSKAPFGDRLRFAYPPSIHLIQNILSIKAALQAVPPLLEAIEGSQSSLLKGVAERMRDPSLSSLQQEIDDVIDPQALPAKEVERMRMQGALAVHSGRNGRLDIWRKTLTENWDDMDTLTEELQTKYNLPQLQLSMHLKRGFHLSIHRKFLQVKDFPDEFIQVDEGKKIHRFSSTELVHLNARYNDALQEIWKLTEIELGSLLNEIFKVEALTALHRLCDSVAILDTLTSFVTYSSFCPAQTERPKLTYGGPIALQKAYHPTLLDLKPQSAVPNDIFLDETSALHIISGRNQAGKSTFIRTIGLITVMAQTGCMVPAKFASVRILKRIATRFNTSDDISQSQSHFSKEMHDIATIIDGIREHQDSANDEKAGNAQPTQDSNPQSTLVLIDELGRSTSTLDGFSIAYAVAEYLSSCPNVLTLFTTHFLGLGAMAKVYPVINAFHLETVPVPNEREPAHTEQESLAQRKFTYTVLSGILTDTSYGIDTARLAGFPDRVTKEARDLLPQMPVRNIHRATDFAKAHFALSEREKRQLQKAKSVVSVAQRISLIQSSANDPGEVRRLLMELQIKVRNSQQRGKNRVGQASGSRATSELDTEAKFDDTVGESSKG